MRIKNLLLAGWLSLVLSGCVGTPLMLPVEDDAFAARGITSVAVQPVVFRDGGPSNHCELDVENRLRFYLTHYLQAKGYDVIRVERPALRNTGLPDPLADEAPDNILGQTPAGVDAVLVVWIDLYRPFALCERSRHRYLEMDASAALYSVAERAAIWRNRAYVADYSSADPIFYVTHQIPRQLLVTLPGR